jgi:hypothetical protein
VKAARDTGALQRLFFGILWAGGHQARHLIFSQLNLAAAEGGKANVGDLELVGWSRHDEGNIIFGLWSLDLNWYSGGGSFEGKLPWGLVAVGPNPHSDYSVSVLAPSAPIRNVSSTNPWRLWASRKETRGCLAWCYLPSRKASFVLICKAIFDISSPNPSMEQGCAVRTTSASRAILPVTVQSYINGFYDTNKF